MTQQQAVAYEIRTRLQSGLVKYADKLRSTNVITREEFIATANCKKTIRHLCYLYTYKALSRV